MVEIVKFMKCNVCLCVKVLFHFLCRKDQKLSPLLGGKITLVVFILLFFPSLCIVVMKESNLLSQQ